MDIWLIIRYFHLALYLAAMELTSFIAAHMMQYLIFVTKIMFWLLLKYAKPENIKNIYIGIYICIKLFCMIFSIQRNPMHVLSCSSNIHRGFQVIKCFAVFYRSTRKVLKSLA